jgi:hypothetical protein
MKTKLFRIPRVEVIETALSELEKLAPVGDDKYLATVVVADSVFPELISRMMMFFAKEVEAAGIFERAFPGGVVQFCTEIFFKKENSLVCIDWENLNTIDEERFCRHFKSTIGNRYIYNVEDKVKGTEIEVSIKPGGGKLPSLNDLLHQRQRTDIASRILASLISSSQTVPGGVSKKEAARKAVAYTDALLKELSQSKENTDIYDLLAKHLGLREITPGHFVDENNFEFRLTKYGFKKIESFIEPLK